MPTASMDPTTHRAALSPVQAPATARRGELTAVAKSLRTKAAPLPLCSSASPSPHSSNGFVGSPINFLKSPNQHQSSHHTPSSIVAISPLRKPRPATATTAATTSGTASAAMIHALITTHSQDATDATSDPSPVPKRRAPALPRPTTASPTVGTDPGVDALRRHVQRCAGCGAYAELCMACFSQLKRRDGAAYKKQIAASVEMLFQRATARAFTKMSHVILTWIFGTWKRETAQQRRRRALAVHVMETRRLQRLWRAWHTFIYERRIVGAMLYAQQQQQATREKSQEIAQLHGDAYERRAHAQLDGQLHQDALAQLRLQLDTQQRSLQNKNQELLALRKELADARERIARLEKQSIDPKELERIRTENVDAKKMVFQLASGVLQSLETQLDVVTSSEGRQTLTGVLSKDVVQLLDKPEHPGFFNPLVELVPSHADAPTATVSYDAPVDRADRILLQWVNFLLQRQQAQAPDWLAAPRVVNFGSSLADGRAWALLTKTLHAAMCKVRPRRPTTGGNASSASSAKLEAVSVLRENGEDLTEIAMERYVDHVKREDAPPKRLELLLATMAPALWMPVGLLRASDVLAGDAEINFATLTYLFCTFSPCHDDAHYALCNDLKGQLASAKAKWRELRDAAFGALGGPSSGGGSGSGSGTSSSATMVAMASNATPPSGSGGLEDASLVAKLKLVLAQTLELKKRLDAEDAKAREGHLLWWKSARVVLRKCFLSYARLARGKAGVLAKLEAAQDENEIFSKLPPRSRLADLELPFEDFAWELKMLQTYIGSVHCDLARIYRGYATRTDASNQFITVGELLELLTECRVVDGVQFTIQDAQSVVRRLDPKLVTGAVSTTRSVTPSEFLEALIRVARRKYSGEHHRVTLSEAFCLLVDNFILPFAFRADADVFRKQVEDPKIRRLLLKFADELRELYSAYAVDDARRRAARKRPRVTAFTFSQCLLDRNVQDVTFNSEKVRAVVQRVARTCKKEVEEAAPNAVVVEEDELTFEEFEEAMIVSACYKFPDPYISLESRVEKFLTFYVRGNGSVTGAGRAPAPVAGK